MSEIDFAALNEAALSRCPTLLETLLPGGKIKGHEYVCSSIDGGSGSSLSVNLYTGKWADFACGIGGHDLISLIAEKEGANQVAAARMLAERIGFTLPEKPKPKARQQEGKARRPAVMQPVPEEIAGPARITHPRHGEPSETYCYRDQEGRLMGYVCRFTLPELDKNKKNKKEFAPFVCTDAGWRFQDFKTPYPFYGLPGLANLPSDALIVVVEGEHKADALQAVLGPNMAVLGLYGGSSRAAMADYSLLAGKRVVYWPDNDQPGAKAAIAFATGAQKTAASVKIIRPPLDAKETWDCADAITDGMTRADIMDFMGAARHDPAEFEKLAAERWEPGGQQEKKGAPERAPLVCVNVADFIGMTIPEREMLLAPILPKQGLAMLHAARGVGKTYLGLCVAYAVASGGEVFGRWKAPNSARVLYLDGEMPARTLQERITSIAAASSSDITAADNLRILTPDLQREQMPNLATDSGQQDIEPFLAGTDLVILDNLATLCRGGRSNDEESWLPVQGWLLGLRRQGKSVLVVHHQGKGGDQRGTSAKEDILDTVIALKRPADYEMCQGARFEVHLTKARGICGEDAKPFEAALDTAGGFKWRVRDIGDSKKERLQELVEMGLKPGDICEEINISRATFFRWKEELGLKAK